jgi:hypothetical protein
MLPVTGTSMLTFLALSEGTGVLGLLRLIRIRPSRRHFPPWRLLAFCRFFVLYLMLTLAQFIWLIKLDRETRYELVKSSEEFHKDGVGDFGLQFDIPMPPFSDRTATTFLTNFPGAIPISFEEGPLQRSCHSYLLTYPLDNSDFIWSWDKPT